MGPCSGVKLREAVSFLVLVQTYCYLIIRNAEASLVEIKSRDRHYVRILLFLRAHGCNMNVNSAFFHVILNGRFLHLNSGMKTHKKKTKKY